MNSQILIDAKALIDTPEKWIKGNYAQDKDGNYVTLGDIGAVCYCSVGAVRESNGWYVYSEAEMILQEAVCRKFGKGVSIPAFNDTSEHADVMAMFDDAIQIAKDEEQWE